MKKNTKIGLTFAILSAFVIIIGVVFALLANKEKTIQENMVIIRAKYTEFSMNVVNHSLASESLTKEFLQSTEEEYQDKLELLTELLTTYSNTIASLNKNVADLEDKCTREYEDFQVNLYCDNYQQLYEILNNTYIDNMNNINAKVTEYNKNNSTNYPPFKLVNTEYIDFNKDGTYEGKTTK